MGHRWQPDLGVEEFPARTQPDLHGPLRRTRLAERALIRKWADEIRNAMGYAIDWSRRMDLADMTPRAELASSRYCLANPGTEYLIFLPADSKTVTLSLPPGRYEWLWFNTTNGNETANQVLDHRDDNGKRHRHSRRTRCSTCVECLSKSCEKGSLRKGVRSQKPERPCGCYAL